MISFEQDITTLDALGYMARLQWVVIRNTARAVNRAAHGFPWVFISAVLIAAVLTGYVMVGKARAERDSYGKEAYQLQQRLDSITLVLEARR